MNVLKWAIAGLVGGAVAAGAWAAAHGVAGVDLGWAAWIVGAVAGICVRLAAGRVRGEEPALVAVAVAALALVGGKLGVATIDVRNELESGAGGRSGLLADLKKPTTFDRVAVEPAAGVVATNGASYDSRDRQGEYRDEQPPAAPTDDTLANAMGRQGEQGAAAEPTAPDGATAAATDPAPAQDLEQTLAGTTPGAQDTAQPATTAPPAGTAAAPVASAPRRAPVAAASDRPITKDLVVAVATLPGRFAWTDAVWFGLAVVTAYLIGGGGGTTVRRTPEPAAM